MYAKAMHVSKNPVQDALDLVNKYDKSTASKYQQSLPSKGDIKHDDRTKDMQKKLIASKQRVVHHLRISRSLERNILQAEVVETAMKAQLVNRVEKDRAGKVADRIKDNHRSAGSSISQSWLESSDLRIIEDILGLEMGHASIIQNTLNRYDDSKLCKELACMPQSSRSKMALALFTKITKDFPASLFNFPQQTYSSSKSLFHLEKCFSTHFHLEVL